MADAMMRGAGYLRFNTSSAEHVPYDDVRAHQINISQSGVTMTELKIALSAHTKISIEMGDVRHYERWAFIEEAPVEFTVDAGDRSKPGWSSEMRQVSLRDLVLAWCEKHGETLSVG
jgi:hypothetical protein